MTEDCETTLLHTRPYQRIAQTLNSLLLLHVVCILI